MRKNYLKVILLLGIVFVAMGNVCLAEEQPAAGGTATAGYIDAALKNVQDQIDTFHDRLNNEQYDAIVQDASNLLKNQLGADKLFTVEKQLHQTLGQFVHVRDKKLHFVKGAPSQVRAIYDSNFENANVIEVFTFIREDGKSLQLASYQVEGRNIDLGFLAYMDWDTNGETEASKGNFDTAIADYTKSIAIYSDAEAYLGRAAAYTAKRKFAQASADLDKALALQPAQGAFVTYLRGNIQLGQKHYEQAAAEFDKAIQSAPGFAEPYYGKACVLEAEKQYPQAVSGYQEFLTQAGATVDVDPALVDDAQKRIEQLQKKISKATAVKSVKKPKDATKQKSATKQPKGHS